MTILITGGTGSLGSALVPLLTNNDSTVRVLSRNPHPAADGVQYVVGDVSIGAGLEAAFAGVDVVMHLAGSAKDDAARARHVVDAAEAAGVRHLVYISAVGSDRIPVQSRVDRAMFGYFDEKRIAEQIISGSSLGWTTLRATQFHDFVTTTLDQLAKSPVSGIGAVARRQLPADRPARRRRSAGRAGGRRGPRNTALPPTRRVSTGLISTPISSNTDPLVWRRSMWTRSSAPAQPAGPVHIVGQPEQFGISGRRHGLTVAVTALPQSPALMCGTSPSAHLYGSVWMGYRHICTHPYIREVDLMSVGFVAYHYPQPDQFEDFVDRTRQVRDIFQAQPGCEEVHIWAAPDEEAVVTMATFESQAAYEQAFTAVAELGQTIAFDDRERKPRQITNLVSR